MLGKATSIEPRQAVACVVRDGVFAASGVEANTSGHARYQRGRSVCVLTRCSSVRRIDKPNRRVKRARSLVCVFRIGWRPDADDSLAAAE